MIGCGAASPPTSEGLIEPLMTPILSLFPTLLLHHPSPAGPASAQSTNKGPPEPSLPKDRRLVCETPGAARTLILHFPAQRQPHNSAKRKVNRQNGGTRDGRHYRRSAAERYSLYALFYVLYLSSAKPWQPWFDLNCHLSTTARPVTRGLFQQMRVPSHSFRLSTQ